MNREDEMGTGGMLIAVRFSNLPMFLCNTEIFINIQSTVDWVFRLSFIEDYTIAQQILNLVQVHLHDRYLDRVTPVVSLCFLYF